MRIRIKKLLIILLAVFLLMSFGGCKKKTEIDDQTIVDNNTIVDVDSNKDSQGQYEETHYSKELVHYVENYDIAVVFDNSGSMYSDYNAQGWCRAKYAMEIFASMLNYEQRGTVPGDELRIYPMWAVTTDGSKPTEESAGSTDPILISSMSDIEKIHNLFTIRAWSTPYSTVEKAYSSLTTSTAPQKWLLVLTDGEFDDLGTSELGQKLATLASDDIKVVYLGIGEAADLSSYASDNFYTKKSNSSENLKLDIIEICNMMFQRDQLPSDRLNGDQLTLDISMSNLIVFVQGENAKINGMKDKEGKEVEILSDSGQIKYSSINSANYPDAPVDSTLSGQVVTFGECDAGTYTISYEDAESILFFYTPNIDIMLTFSDEDGTVLDVAGRNEKLYPGDYILNYYLIDSVTGEDVTNSALLKPVAFVGGYEFDDGIFHEVSNGDRVTLEPNNSIFLKVKATYLNDYQITTENRKEDYTITISYPTVDVHLDTEQEDNWFLLSKKDSWKPFVATLTIDGKSLTDYQLEGTELNISFDKDIPYTIEKVYGESKVNIYLGKEVNADEITKGKNTIYAKANYLHNGDGQVLYGHGDSEEFTIQFYPKWARWAALGLLLLLLLLLILLLMNMKAFPLFLGMEDDRNGYGRYNFKRGQIMDLFPYQSGKITCYAEKITKFSERKTSYAKAKIFNINVASDITEVIFDGERFVKRVSGLVNSDGTKINEASFEIGDGFEVIFKDNKGRHKGTIKYER